MDTQNIEVTGTNEPVAVVTPEVIETQTEVTPSDSKEPETPVIPDAPEMSDAELEAFIANILAQEGSPEEKVTEPQFGKETETKAINDLTIINELIDAQAKETLEKEKVEAENKEALKMLEQVQSSVAEKQAEIDAVNELYNNIEEVLSPEIAKAIAFNDTDSIPKIFIKEHRDRVETHPVIGPFVQALLEGKDVDIPKLLRAAAKLMPTIPNVASIEKNTNTEPVKSEPVISNILRTAMAQRGL